MSIQQTCLLLLFPLLLAAAEPKLPGARPVIEAADFPSLQAAIDAVPATGGLLRLPPGEFKIAEPLRIRHEDFRMTGAGTATHIVNTNTNGQPAIVIVSDSFADAKKTRPKSLWRVALDRFRVTGNEKSGHGIAASRIDELFIEAVTISYHGGDGIHCLFCTEDMRLANSLITYNKGAGFFAEGNHDTIVSANQFEENLDAVRFVDGYNLCMSGNNLDDHLRHGVVVENTYGSIVSANMIEECNGTAIILDRDCYGITLAANVIAHDFGGGIELRDAHGIAVSANSFPLCKKFAVRVGPDSARVTITGNAFCDSWVGGKPLRQGGNKNEADMNEAEGVHLDSTQDITVTGNTFTGLKGKALAVTGNCRRVVYSNNVVTGPAGDEKKLKESKAGGKTESRPKSTP